MADGEVIEWILVEDPPDNVPVAVLRTTAGDHVAPIETQTGTLIMHDWCIDGHLASMAPEPPYRWPVPLRMRGDRVSIDLDSTVAPVEVETRIIRNVDEDGQPDPPVPASWCTYRATPPACRIDRISDDENWVVEITLPPDPGTFFISLRGAWALPMHSAFTNVPEGTTFDAAWLFAVDNT